MSRVAHHEVMARGAGTALSRRTFFAQAALLSRSLPDARYAVNLCEDRLSFAVAFTAVLMREQTNLLPPSRLPAVCDEIAGRYPQSYCIVERRDPGLRSPQVAVGAPGRGRPTGPTPVARDGAPLATPDHVAAVAFTSGSTGTPRANPKPWGSLALGARLAHAQFGLGSLERYTIVATVPPQHMYGLETSVLLPLVCGGSFVTGKTLFPEDIRVALKRVPAPRVLVTTPVHLRALVQSGLRWPEIAIAISATAPLSSALAAEAERTLSTEVHEIFGFSEAGSVASRRTADGEWWRPYAGLELALRDGEVEVTGGHVPRPVPMNDHVEIAGDGRFRLLGRMSDMVNVAGKRASLAELNAKLTRIDGVEDGVFVPPETRAADREHARLGALIVAPTLTRQEVLAKLAGALDPVFMPRPLRLVSALPRNETGKLPRSALIELLRQRDRHPGERTDDAESEPAPHGETGA